MRQIAIAALLLYAAGSILAAEDAKLETTTGVLHGTLVLPADAKKPLPVALIIAGSGPTDRDGNSPLFAGRNDSLRMLAQTLDANGIASLRYDKRGIGASAAAGAAEKDLRFDHYVDDAAAWIRQLRTDPRFSTITVAGHSEGSLIGMLAVKAAGANAFVSIAGAGRSAPVLLREQLAPKLPAELFATSETILGRLTSGESVDSVPSSLAILYRPSVQPYLISWFRYDPAVEVAKLKVPVLIIQGTTDIQTTKTDAEALYAAAKGSELAMIEGMNHVLKTVDDDFGRQISSYSDPKLPLHAELGARITAFIAKLGPKPD